MGKIIVVGDEKFANQLRLELSLTRVEVLHTPEWSEDLQREFGKGNLVFVSTLLGIEKALQMVDGAKRAGFFNLICVRAGAFPDEMMEQWTRATNGVWIERSPQLARFMFKVVRFTQNLTPRDEEVSWGASRAIGCDDAWDEFDDAWTDHLIETGAAQV